MVGNEQILKFLHGGHEACLHIFGKLIVHIFPIVWGCTVFDPHLTICLCHVDSHNTLNFWELEVHMLALCLAFVSLQLA